MNVGNSYSCPQCPLSSIINPSTPHGSCTITLRACCRHYSRIMPSGLSCPFTLFMEKHTDYCPQIITPKLRTNVFVNLCLLFYIFKNILRTPGNDIIGAKLDKMIKQPFQDNGQQPKAVDTRPGGAPTPAQAGRLAALAGEWKSSLQQGVRDFGGRGS